MKVGSLFSGIGGLDLGLERAGMEIRWQVENDPFCRGVLAKHWPDVPCYGDIREVDGGSIEPVDLICGGFPCQPTSHAGRRRGEDDDRWLWPEMLRLIREARPAYVVGENVFGLVTHNEGLLLASVVSDLEAEGYEVSTPVVFPACAVGAPHLRERVWIVAHANGSELRDQHGRSERQGGRSSSVVADDGKPWSVADTEGQRGALREAARERSWRPASGGSTVPNADSEPENGPAIAWGECNHWAVEPDVGRVAHGVPGRMDRLSALGNAVVPQAAELIGRHIMAVLA